MSAEVLRQAASLMRERAEAAESGMAGPWEAKVLTDGRAWIAGDFDSLSLHGYPAVAEHIAGMSPDVALALAGWLDDEAQALDNFTSDFPDAEPLVSHYALAVARAHLGSDA